MLTTTMRQLPGGLGRLQKRMESGVQAGTLLKCPSNLTVLGSQGRRPLGESGLSILGTQAAMQPASWAEGH